MIFNPSRFNQNLTSIFWSIEKKYLELFWLLGISLAAIILFSINLGGVPLRDWDEGIVASVAKEIYLAPLDSYHWLYPTLDGQPYWNKPPLIHWLIALAYGGFGINEWTTRLPTAILSALSVPLVYAVGREIFKQSSPAIFAALVYLTLLPSVRHGRLAMLDGAIVCFSLLTIWSILRSRWHIRAVWGVGLGLGLICLTKGLMLGFLIGSIALIFVLWDCPLLLMRGYLWWGIILGLIPALTWYLFQYLHYGAQFTQVNLVEQTFSRIWLSVSDHRQPAWYYFGEILKYAHPWLLFLPEAIILALRALRSRSLRDRASSWAKLTLTWSLVYLLAISLMATKLPWYIMPIYPAFSLLIGAKIARYWHSSSHAPISKFFWLLLTLASWIGTFVLVLGATETDNYLELALITIAVTFTLTTILFVKQSRYFIVSLIGGLYLAFLLFFSSQYWVWELGEAYPVKPVAAMIKQVIPSQKVVFTSYPYHRPSLNFYSDRRVIPVSVTTLKQYWLEEKESYFLIKPDLIDKLDLKPQRILGQTDRWQVITQDY